MHESKVRNDLFPSNPLPVSASILRRFLWSTIYGRLEWEKINENYYQKKLKTTKLLAVSTKLEDLENVKDQEKKSSKTSCFDI